MRLNFFKIKKGDIVLYVDPSNGDKEYQNIITIVLSVFPLKGTAVIRGIRTTACVPQKHLQVLSIDKNSPIRVPEIPKADVCFQGTIGVRAISEGDKLPENSSGISSPGNQAFFHEIPLSWFNYRVGINEAGELFTK